MGATRWVPVIGLAVGAPGAAWAQASGAPTSPPFEVDIRPILQIVEQEVPDYTSQTLTVEAWRALTQRDHARAEAYAKLCIWLYAEEAQVQQGALTAFAPNDRVHDSWALNDVATSYFILGESLRLRRRLPEAAAMFERVAKEYGFAQCWDPRGWFWKVADGARIRPLDAGHGLGPWALARGRPERGAAESRDDVVGATGSARGDPLKILRIRDDEPRE